MITKLLKLADDLDKIKAKIVADEVDNLLIRLANLHIQSPPTCLEDESVEGWNRYHDWVKSNPHAWNQCAYHGIQEAPYRTHIERYEMKNCPLCNSTLYKKLPSIPHNKP